jgi:hypothetical protein
MLEPRCSITDWDGGVRAALYHAESAPLVPPLHSGGVVGRRQLSSVAREMYVHAVSSPG